MLSDTAIKSYFLDGFHMQVFIPAVIKQKNIKIFFAHATGIAAPTYKSFLKNWAQAWGIEIHTYDMRGFGLTRESSAQSYLDFGRKDLMSALEYDHEQLYWHLRGQNNAVQWIFAGHSLGGWMSLFAAAHCHVREVILFDIALLRLPQASLWAAACLTGQRHLHTLAKHARRRKKTFKSVADMARLFGRMPFFKNWPKARIQDYIDANYEARADGVHLRHEPHWEADVFESQPTSMSVSLLKIEQGVRNSLNINIILGSESKVSHPQAGVYLKKFFDNTAWMFLPDAGHMLTFEKEEALIHMLEAIKNKIIPAKQIEYKDDLKIAG